MPAAKTRYGRAAMFAALLLALALSMDATAVAAGRAVTGMSRKTGYTLALFFGIFQAGMAALGWVLGASAKDVVERWDHWIAFGLLAAIGGKMLYEAFSADDDADAPVRALDLKTMMILSIATSIDALAAGVTLPTLGVEPTLALALIGVATFLLSALGAAVGASLGARFGKRLEILGGLTLIAIGTKTLLDHLGYL